MTLTAPPNPSAQPKSPEGSAEPDAAHAALLAALEVRLGWTFHDRAWLVQAVTHPTYTNELRQRGGPGHSGPVGPSGPSNNDAAHTALDNQRLEFLGDAIVGLCTSELVFGSDPHAREGVLTQRRAALVHEARLARAARELALGPCLRLGRGELANGMQDRTSVLADAFEAVVAALWCDAGPEARTAVRALFERVFAEDLAAAGGPALHKPVKARLQEATQHAWKQTPQYALIAERPAGPAAFEVEVKIGTRITARGTGRSRREAEQAAAEGALATFERGAEPAPSAPTSSNPKPQAAATE